jgi:hypothetical protein
MKLVLVLALLTSVFTEAIDSSEKSTIRERNAVALAAAELKLGGPVAGSRAALVRWAYPST